MSNTTVRSPSTFAEPTIWGIHMGRQHGSKPVDEGYVSIGWRQLGDLTKLPASRDALKDLIQTSCPQTKAGAVPGHAGILYRFAHEMRRGDIRPPVVRCEDDR